MNRLKSLALVIILATIALSQAQSSPPKEPDNFKNIFKYQTDFSKDEVNGIIPLPDGRFFFVYKHNLYTTKQKWIDLSLKIVGPDWQQVQLHSVINSVNDSSKCLILLGVVCKQEMCTFLLGCSNNYYLLKSQSDGQGTPSAVNITNLSKDPNQIKVSHCQEMMVFAHFEGQQLRQYMVSPDSDIQNFNKNFPVPEASNNQRINLECVSDPSAGTFYTVLMDGSTIKVWKRDSSKNYVLQKTFTPQKEYLSSQYDDFVVWIKKEGATERLVLLNLQRDTDALIVKTSIKLIILPKDNTPTWELTLIEKKISREGSSNVNLYYHDNEDRFSPLKLIKTDTIGQVFILGTKVNN